MGAGLGACACFHRVHWCRLSRASGPAGGGSCPLVVCSLLLSALLLCLCCVACKYGSISRFKGVFSVVWGCRVGLCVLCGFCARVELGGLKARCVFAFVFPLLCLSFYLFTCFLSFCPSLVWLPFVFLVCLCVFFFPCGLYVKRKGAPCWCVLSCPVVVLSVQC